MTVKMISYSYSCLRPASPLPQSPHSDNQCWFLIQTDDEGEYEINAGFKHLQVNPR